MREFSRSQTSKTNLRFENKEHPRESWITFVQVQSLGLNVQCYINPEVYYTMVNQLKVFPTHPLQLIGSFIEILYLCFYCRQI